MQVWDVVLILGVSTQGTVIAYIKDARIKALMMLFPLPFTFGALAVNRPVDATNAIGLLLLGLFMHFVRLAHHKLRLPVVLAIAIGSVAYCVIGTFLAPIVPAGSLVFWIATGAIGLVASLLLKFFPVCDEAGYRTPLPIWIKLPSMIAVVSVLLLLKSNLLGFMTMFPMIGVITAYETRHSLWTTCQKVPFTMYGVGVVMVTARLGQDTMGLGWSLALGWAIMLAGVAIAMRLGWLLPRKKVPA